MTHGVETLRRKRDEAVMICSSVRVHLQLWERTHYDIRGSVEIVALSNATKPRQGGPGRGFGRLA